MQNTENNARAVGESKGLILATTVWYEFFAGFFFCHMYSRQLPKQIPQNLFIIPNRKNVSECESTQLINYAKHNFESLKAQNSPAAILGDPGAASRDNGIFIGESLQQELESPWALTLTERVPKAFEILPSDWPEKYGQKNIFLAIQRTGTAGRLSCLLTRGCFPHRTP